MKCNLVNFEITKNGSAEQGGEFQGIRGKIGPQTLSVRDRKTISAMALVEQSRWEVGALGDPK